VNQKDLPVFHRVVFLNQIAIDPGTIEMCVCTLPLFGVSKEAHEPVEVSRVEEVASRVEEEHSKEAAGPGTVVVPLLIAIV